MSNSAPPPLAIQYAFRGNIVTCLHSPFAPTSSDIHSAIELAPGLLLYLDHVLTVDTNGIIRHLEPYSDNNSILWQQSAQESIALQEHEFLIPGLIDCHIHAPQYSFAGTATDRPLLGPEGWLEHYTYPAERRLRDDLHHAQHVYESVVQTTLRHGTTTALYFATLDVEPCKILVDVCRRFGQRALIGKVCMDQNAPHVQSVAQNCDETIQLIQYIRDSKNNNNNLIWPVVTPRFVPTCSPELLTALGEIAQQYNVHVTSHISESADQVAFSKEPDATVFDRHGLLTNQCVMAHGTYLSESDRQLLRSRGTAVAHCPLSNFFFSSDRVFACQQFLQEQNKVGLGSDIAGGYHPSILHAARMAVVASRCLQSNNHALDYRHAFYLATLGGAEALNMNDRIGSLQIGKVFDAVILSAHHNWPVQVFDNDTTADVFQKLCNLGDDRSIKRVFVQGKDVTIAKDLFICPFRSEIILLYIKHTYYFIGSSGFQIVLSKIVHRYLLGERPKL